MADYDVGSAALSIVPSFKGVVEAITAEAKKWATSGSDAFSSTFNQKVRDQTSKVQLGPDTPTTSRQGDKSGGAFADSFKKRVTAALKSLPDAEIDADSSEADRKIADIRAQLEELSGKTIGIDIGDDEALAKLAALKAEIDDLGASSPSINIAVDAARASAELAAVQAEVDALRGETVTINVRADTAEADAAIEATAAAGDAAGGGGPVGGGISLLAAGAPALIPLGGAAILGAAGGAAGLLAGGAGLGALALGISGITGAVKATTAARTADAKQSATGSASEISNANQVRSAEESLAETKQNAVAAEISSAEQVKSARESLASTEREVSAEQVAASQRVVQAQQTEKAASEQVASALQAENLAREQATRELQDYQNAAVDAHLSAQQAALNLTDANTALSAAQTNPATTAEQLQQAQLNVAQAQQAVIEANEQATRSSEDNTKAQVAGINGDAGVVAASKQVATARRAQASATRELQAAQAAQRAETVDGAAKIATAERGVSDALRAQSNQQRESAFAIVQAENSVATAMQSQAKASSTVADANFAQQQALAKLTPQGRAFAAFIVGTLLPAVGGLKKDAQANLLPGLEEGIKGALPDLPLFAKLVKSVSSEVGDLAAAGGRTLSDPFWTKFFGFVDKTASPTLRTFVKILENVVTGFVGLAEDVDPAVNILGADLVKITGHFAEFGKNAGTDSGWQEFLAGAERDLPVVGHFLDDGAVAVDHIVTALAPFGVDILGGVDELFKLISSLSPAEVEALTIAIIALLSPLTDIPTAVAVVVGGLVSLYDHSKTFRDYVDQNVLPILKDLGGYFENTIAPVLEHVAKDELGGLEDAFHSVSGAIETNKVPLEEFLDALKILATFFIQHVLPIFGHEFSAEIQIFGKEIAVAIDLVSLLIRGIVAEINLGIDVLNAFIRILDKILGPFNVHIDTIPHITAPKSSPTNSAQATGVGNSRASDQLLAAGGTIGSGFVTRGPRAIVGEGNPAHPEFVIPTDPAYRPRALDLFSSLGTHLLAGGGILGGLKSLAGDAAAFARHLTAAGAAKALGIAEAPARALLSAMPDSFIRTMLGGIIDKVNAAAVGKIRGATSGGSTAGGDTGAHSVTARVAQAYARAQLPAFGWDGAQMPPLIKLWNAESGWNPFAANPNSPAYGIPQADPGSKMASAGADWRTNYMTQIDWGLGYIKGGYDDPSRAWLQEETNFRHFPYQGHPGPPYGYDSGGQMPPGVNLVANGTRKPERVLTDRQWADISSLASSGGSFEGNLYLDSGEFFGAVRGEASAVADARDARALVKSRKP